MRNVTKILLILLTWNLQASSLSFDTALKQIVEKDPDVGISENEFKALEKRNLPNDLIYLPSLSLKAAHSTSKGPGEISSNHTQSAYGELNLNLYHFGSDSAKKRASQLEEDSAKDRWEHTKISAEGAAVDLLIRYLSVHLEEEIQKRIIQMRETSLNIAESRFKKGLLPRQEVQKIRIDKDNALVRYSEIESRLVGIESELKTNLGTTEIEIKWPWIERLSGEWEVEQDPSILAQRPDWKSAQAILRQTEEKIDQSWGEMMPSLDVSGTLGYLNQDQGKTDGLDWSAMATLTIPLFDRLERYGKYKEQVHLKSVAQLRFEKVKRLAKQQWETAKASFLINLKSARERDKTLELSRKLYQDNLERFRRGLVSANELILDLNRLFDSESFAVLGWAQVHRNFASLCHSVGKRVSNCLGEP